MKDLAGYRVLVTGAGSGIGAACAKLFAENGCVVTGVSRTIAEEEKVLPGGGKLITKKLDVTDEEKWDLNEKYGKLVFGELRKLLESRKWKRAEEAERIKLAEEIIKDAKLDILEDFLKERNVK